MTILGLLWPARSVILLLVLTQLLASGAEPTAVSPPGAKPTLFLIGDSTVRNRTRGQLGWGDSIAGWFDSSRIAVTNCALGGRSSRTFLTEGLWDQVLSGLKPGDSVLIQFGHNDGGPLDDGRARASLKGSSEESRVVTNKASGKVETVRTYGWYLRKYIADAKAKGATPIVLSLVPRKIWKDGRVVRASNDYSQWAAQAAKAEGVGFVDLNNIVARHYEELGPEKVNNLFADDHTHTNPEGARLNAQSVVEGLRALKDCALAKYLVAVAAQHHRALVSMDLGWKFALGELPGAEQAGFDDSSWRSLDVPHDWSIEGPFAETNKTGGAGGFLSAGIGWYHKGFTLPAADAQRLVFVEFDGVMANSDVWINGFYLGRRPYGYVSFRYELTGHLNFGEGKTNLLAVRADNSAQPASRWYTGAGIYRHVRLVVTDPVHLDQWGPFVITPQVTSNQALVHVQTTVLNQSATPREIMLETTIYAPDGRPVQTTVSNPETLAPDKSAVFRQQTTLAHPQLWDLVTPVRQPLYRLSVKVRSSEAILDDALATFGIREARFEAATGFWLNGRNLKLKGVCLHHDAGGLGAAVPLRAWERRLELLKQVGCNAIRTAHNPVAPEFLDLCDRMGFLVMDEMFDCWTVGKNPHDYHLYFKEWSKRDVRDTVCRDRNHPSIVVYSAGNEIRDTPKAELAKTILGGLVEVFHECDPTRPVSQGLFRPNVSHDYDNGLADLLDVIGQNYREDEILAAHRSQPARKILGTENGHDRKVWLALRDNPPCAGQFLWTGFDYLGESRRWPVVAAGSGLFDRTGAPRPRAFQRQSWWSDQPMVHIVRRLAPDRATPADPGFDPLTRRQQEFSDWTPRDSDPRDENVEVHSNCEQVELLLNGKSLGSQPLPPDAAPRAWKVAFEPGTVRALGKNKGQVVATHELRTAGKPARIRLTADRARLTLDWDDASYVTAAVVDADGVLVPDATDLVSFKLSGPGKIAAVDSGDNSSHESFLADMRHAYQGQCIAILKATAPAGQIRLTASARGLASEDLVLAVVSSPETKLKFDFGSSQAEPGCVPVLPTTLYTRELGYGFESGSTIAAEAGSGENVRLGHCCTSNQPFLFSVALAEGNYDVTVRLGDAAAGSTNTIKAESRRLMLEQVITAPGQAATRAFTVNVRTPRLPDGGAVRLKEREKDVLHWDDKLTLEFNGARPAVGRVEIAPATNAITVFLLGDSTVTDQPREPWNSWGQMLPRFFQPGVAVANHAESGESLKSSLSARRIEKVLASVRAGDHVFVQFGHNDQKDRATNALTTYKANLTELVAEVRARGATPVLVTSMERMAGVENDTLGEYPSTMQQVAQEQHVALVDLHAMSRILYRALGPNLKKAFQDGTHHNAYGSYELAKCVVEGIRQNQLPLTQFITSDTPPFSPAEPDPVDAFSVPASPSQTRLKPDGN